MEIIKMTKYIYIDFLKKIIILLSYRFVLYFMYAGISAFFGDICSRSLTSDGIKIWRRGYQKSFANLRRSFHHLFSM